MTGASRHGEVTFVNDGRKLCSEAIHHEVQNLIHRILLFDDDLRASLEQYDVCWEICGSINCPLRILRDPEMFFEYFA